MLRKIGWGVLTVGVVLFGLTLFEAVTGDIPGQCSGSECFHGNGLWVTALPGSIFLFVGGIMMVAFGGRGYGHARGPKDFAQVDTGAFAPRSSAQGGAEANVAVPRQRRWSRSWRNIYVYTGAGELALSLFFFAIAIKQPEARGGMLATGVILSVIGLILLAVGYRAQQKDMLHVTGLDAEAKIVGITHTGLWMNNNPYVKLDLVITVPGHPPYEVEHGEIVPQVLLGLLTKGAPLHLKVDPNKPSHFVIEWERG